VTHPLRVVLDDAAAGRFPPADGRIDVFPSPGDTADAMVAFTGHFVLAADIDPAAVAARAPAGDFSIPMSAAFLEWVAERLGSSPGTHDVLLAAPADPGAAASIPLREADDLDHPRVARAARDRRDVRVFVADDGAGVVVVGRGVCDRWEVAYEVDPGVQSRGLGRALVGAARRLVPPGETVWAQVAPGNAASLRSTLAAGFVPVGAEVLFPRAH
jgi:hypothetical protein